MQCGDLFAIGPVIKFCDAFFSIHLTTELDSCTILHFNDHFESKDSTVLAVVVCSCF